jgi:hypothetical protein
MVDSKNVSLASQVMQANNQCLSTIAAGGFKAKGAGRGRLGGGQNRGLICGLFAVLLSLRLIVPIIESNVCKCDNTLFLGVLAELLPGTILMYIIY